MLFHTILNVSFGSYTMLTWAVESLNLHTARKRMIYLLQMSIQNNVV